MWFAVRGRFVDVRYHSGQAKATGPRCESGHALCLWCSKKQVLGCTAAASRMPPPYDTWSRRGLYFTPARPEGPSPPKIPM